MTNSRKFDTSMPPPSSLPLRVTSTELLHLLDISPDALLIVDREGTIVMANAQAGALFGYRREELHELRLEMLLPEHLRARACRPPAAVFRHAAHTRDGRRTPTVGAAQGWGGVPGGYQFATSAPG